MDNRGNEGSDVETCRESCEMGFYVRLAVGISDDPPHSVVKAVTARKDELARERSSIGRAAHQVVAKQNYKAGQNQCSVGSSPTVPNKK